MDKVELIEMIATSDSEAVRKAAAEALYSLGRCDGMERANKITTGVFDNLGQVA